MTENFELLRTHLDPATEQELLALQTECTFCWSTKDGSPMGVTVTFVYYDGRLWFTVPSDRPRIAAIKRDPRVAVIVASPGTQLGYGKTTTIRGTCRVVTDEDRKRWLSSTLTERLFPDNEAVREKATLMLDSTDRVVLEVTPTKSNVTHDISDLVQRWAGDDAEARRLLARGMSARTA